MTTLDWSSVGNRKYETGVDHGVLYVGNSPGVIWPGLISIDEKPDGGAITSHYLDGVKYLQQESSVDFKGTIEALYSPVEFDPCEGIYAANGMLITHQRKKPFGLSYRTLVANDVLGLKYGYKIHLVYNAIVDTPEKSYASINDSLEPTSLSWDFTCKPIQVAGFKPTAHYIFNSVEMPDEFLTELEDILYGTDTTAPRLPTAIELLTFSDFISHADGGSASSLSYDGIYDGGTATTVPPVFVDAGNA